MNDAGGGNEHIRRVASEIEIGRSYGDLKSDWPNMYLVQSSADLGGMDVNIQPAALGKHSHLPQHDCGNAPCVASQQRFLGWTETFADGEDKNVSIEIKHLGRPKRCTK